MRQFEYVKLSNSLIEKNEVKALFDALDVVKELEQHNAVFVKATRFEREHVVHDEKCFTSAHDLSKKIRIAAAKLVKTGGGEDAMNLYKQTLLFDAPHDFDCAIRYAEWDRDPKKKFYEPRRKQLKIAVDAMQKLEERKINLLGIMMPPGAGKTTTGIMYLIWTGYRHPDLSILGGSHSNSFLRGVYDEILRMIDPDGEYLWHEIFPNVNLAATNAKDMRIDLGRAKRFETFEFSSIGSGNAGKVRASNLLYADDLVDGIESAMSRERMDKLWQMYYTDLRQRMIGDCAELLIQTPWSIHDPIDRLEIENRDNPKAQFIHLPAMNQDDESNFDYPYGVGFSTEFYRKQRDIMDEASWRALYMTQPIEREGQLYSQDELRRYFTLPDGEPDAIIAVCDIADGGGDYWSMPIAYQYGPDFYIHGWIYDNNKPNIVEERVAQALIDHSVDMAQFESNRAGGRVAETIQKKVADANGKTKVTTKWSQSNKETRIIVTSGYVKEHFLFLDESIMRQNKEYRFAVEALCGYTMAGKNKHDDAPDSMSMLVDYINSFETNKVEIIKRMF